MWLCLLLPVRQFFAFWLSNNKCNIGATWGGALGSNAGALGVEEEGGNDRFDRSTVAYGRGHSFQRQRVTRYWTVRMISNGKQTAVGTMKSMESELRKTVSPVPKSAGTNCDQLYDVYLRLIVQAERTVERTTEYINFTAGKEFKMLGD